MSETQRQKPRWTFPDHAVVRVVHYDCGTILDAKDIPLAHLQGTTKDGKPDKEALAHLNHILEAVARHEVVQVGTLALPPDHTGVEVSVEDRLVRQLSEDLMRHVGMGIGWRLEVSGDTITDQEVESFLAEKLHPAFDKAWARTALRSRLWPEASRV